ncbi:MAG: hypothetical protein KDK70_22095 [Myxococcales bacterium]|nr:hypothetical protein [Myxococcales bacterium]
MTRWIAVTLLLGMACGDAPSGATGGSGPAEAAAIDGAEAVAVPGDPLLARARAGIRGGRLPAALEAEVLGSTAEAHARAQRILRAMAASPEGGHGSEGDSGAGEVAAVEPAAEVALRPPPLAVAEEGVPGPEPTGGRTPASGGGGSRVARPTPSPERAGGEVRVSALSLRPTARGATLTLAAPSSLVVGVANQPASGIVRLVIESAQAGGSLLTARPRVDGATVTAVRQGQGTVQITLRLDPGWRLGKVQPFSGGARVHLVGP